MRTVDELEAIIRDGNGWGYASGRGYTSPRLLVVADQAVVDRANALKLSDAEFALWLESKDGRHAAERFSEIAPDSVSLVTEARAVADSFISVTVMFRLMNESVL